MTSLDNERRLLGRVLSLCLVGAIAGCGSSARPRRLSVAGLVRVDDQALLSDNGPEAGSPCPRSLKSLADIGDGAAVVVSDDHGALAGKTTLGPGRTYRDYRERTGGCEWTFTVTLSSASTYRFAVAGQPPRSIGGGEVRAKAKDLELLFQAPR